MPTVGRYSGSQVEQSAVPNVNVNTQVSPDEFGGGESTGRVFEAANKIFEKAKQDADQIAVLDANAKRHALKTKLLFDPQNGALNKKGKDAMDVPEQVFKDYDNGMAEIEKGLYGDRQKQAFRDMYETDKSDINETLQRHVSSQREVYREQVLKANEIAGLDSIKLNYYDPKKVADKIGAVTQMYDMDAQTSGIATELNDVRKADFTSKAHASVVSTIINDTKNPNAYLNAKSYYADNKDAINGDDRAVLERALETKGLDHESLRLADEYYSKYKSKGESAAIAATDSITDLELKKATRQAIRQTFGEVDAAKDRDQEKAYNFLYKQIEAGGGDWKKFTTQVAGIDNPTRRDNLKNIGKKERHTDPAFKSQVIQWTRTPETFAKFQQMNPLDFRDKFSDEDWYWAQNLQKKGFQDEELKGIRTTTEVIQSAYRNLNKEVPSPSDSNEAHKQYDEFRQQIQEQISLSGNNSRDNIEKIANGLATQEVMNRGFFGDSTLPVYKLTPAKVDLRLLDPVKINEIKIQLMKDGKATTEENIKELYVQARKAGRF